MKRTLFQTYATVLMLVGTTLVASASTAYANLTICNRRAGNLRLAFTINDNPNCSGAWRQLGWFVVGGTRCMPIPNTGNLLGKEIYTWAGNDDGTAYVPSGTFLWDELPTFHDMCFSDVQLACSNPGATCPNMPHIHTHSNGSSITLTFL